MTTLILLVGTLLAAPAEPPADLVLLNGKVATMNETRPVAGAVAVRANRIVLVGNDASVRALIGPETRVIDLGGKLLVPGLNDSHVHFISGCLSLEQVDVSRANLAEIQSRLRERARARPNDPWIVGRGWSYAAVPGRLPNRQDLDAAVDDRPVFLTAYDGHTGWANTRALEMTGITKDTPQPSFGEIVMDASGQPNGLLKESPAMGLVRKAIPQPSHDQRRAALLNGIALARKLGITGIMNANGSREDLELYEELDREGLLTLRTLTALPLTPNLTPADLEEYERLRQKYRHGNVRAGTVKAYIDGVVETHTAAMLAPYADDPSQSGTPTMTQEVLDRWVAEFDRRRFQIYIHSIGDRGVRMTLDALEKAARANPAWDRRHRVDHIEVIAREDIPRFGKSGILASIQATHYFPQAQSSEDSVWQRNVGKDRLPLAFAWQSIAEAGGRLCFGSDWPVATPNPMIGLRNAAARADQRLSPVTALRAYTIDAAYAAYDETERGSLAPGKLADMVVLSGDILTLPPMEIAKVEALLTIFDGRVVYQSEKWKGTD